MSKIKYSRDEEVVAEAMAQLANLIKTGHISSYSESVNTNPIWATFKLIGHEHWGRTTKLELIASFIKNNRNARVKCLLEIEE